MKASLISITVLAFFLNSGCGGAADHAEHAEEPAAHESEDAPSTPAAEEAITATSVVDQASLMAFVQAAKEFYMEASQSSSHDMASQMLRSEDGPWRTDEIYVFIATEGGLMLMHGADTTLDGQDLHLLEDANGVMIMQELTAAATGGGGFVEYLFDNPGIEGDEETGTPKVSYAELMEGTGLDGDSPVLIGAGYYE